MTRPVAVLRPEPGNAATIERLAAIGLTAIRLPLFDVAALDWQPPDPAAFDALMLTSANAVRCAGGGLAALAGLPVLAVGAATAEAARAAGLTVAQVGSGDAAALAAEAETRGIRRALLLAGRDRMLDTGGIVARAIAIYASDPLPVTAAALAALAGSVAMLHSTRAASRLAEMVDAAGSGRAVIRLAAISRPVAAAAGPRWAQVGVAATPTDAALVACAATLAD